MLTILRWSPLLRKHISSLPMTFRLNYLWSEGSKNKAFWSKSIQSDKQQQISSSTLVKNKRVRDQNSYERYKHSHKNRKNDSDEYGYTDKQGRRDRIIEEIGKQTLKDIQKQLKDIGKHQMAKQIKQLLQQTNQNHFRFNNLIKISLSIDATKFPSLLTTIYSSHFLTSSFKLNLSQSQKKYYQSFIQQYSQYLLDIASQVKFNFYKSIVFYCQLNYFMENNKIESGVKQFQSSYLNLIVKQMNLVDLSTKGNTHAINLIILSYVRFSDFNPAIQLFVNNLVQQLPFFPFERFKEIFFLFLDNKKIMKIIYSNSIKILLSTIQIQLQNIVDNFSPEELQQVLYNLTKMVFKYGLLVQLKDKILEELLIHILTHQIKCQKFNIEFINQILNQNLGQLNLKIKHRELVPILLEYLENQVEKLKLLSMVQFKIVIKNYEAILKTMFIYDIMEIYSKQVQKLKYSLKQLSKFHLQKDVQQLLYYFSKEAKENLQKWTENASFLNKLGPQKVFIKLDEAIEKRNIKLTIEIMKLILRGRYFTIFINGQIHQAKQIFKKSLQFISNQNRLQFFNQFFYLQLKKYTSMIFFINNIFYQIKRLQINLNFNLLWQYFFQNMLQAINQQFHQQSLTLLFNLIIKSNHNKLININNMLGSISFYMILMVINQKIKMQLVNRQLTVQFYQLLQYLLEEHSGQLIKPLAAQLLANIQFNQEYITITNFEKLRGLDLRLVQLKIQFGQNIEEQFWEGRQELKEKLSLTQKVILKLNYGQHLDKELPQIHSDNLPILLLYFNTYSDRQQEKIIKLLKNSQPQQLSYALISPLKQKLDQNITTKVQDMFLRNINNFNKVNFVSILKDPVSIFKREVLKKVVTFYSQQPKNLYLTLFRQITNLLQISSLIQNELFILDFMRATSAHIFDLLGTQESEQKYNIWKPYLQFGYTFEPHYISHIIDFMVRLQNPYPWLFEYEQTMSKEMFEMFLQPFLELRSKHLTKNNWTQLKEVERYLQVKYPQKAIPFIESYKTDSCQDISKVHITESIFHPLLVDIDPIQLKLINNYQQIETNKFSFPIYKNTLITITNVQSFKSRRRFMDKLIATIPQFSGMTAKVYTSRHKNSSLLKLLNNIEKQYNLTKIEEKKPQNLQKRGHLKIEKRLAQDVSKLQSKQEGNDQDSHK